MAKSTLSKIISGTMNWGNWDKKLTTLEMEQMINVCFENQISTFDHADIYGDYTTEAQFGRALANSNISRDSIQLISKCGIVNPGLFGFDSYSEKNPNKIKHYNYSKKYIIWAAEKSLKNLKTDYLDVFLLHRPSPLMVADEVAEAITQLQKEGKIIDFGVSNFTPFQTELLQQKIKVCYNQIQFSATHFEPMLDGSLDFMQLNQIKPLIWNPLGDVFRENNEQTQQLKKLLVTLVDKYGVGSDTILLSWVLAHPSGTIPIAGTVNVARIQALKKAISLKLDKEDWFAIWTESMGKRVP